MTKLDFFRIIIKLFGLYSAILTIFNVLPTYIGYNTISEFQWPIVIISLVIVFIVLLILFILIFGADRIINALNLDKGFDEDRIEFGNLNEISILKFSIILIGGFLLIDNIPPFLNHCYLAFKDQVTPKGIDGVFEIYSYEKVDYFRFAVSAISIFLGYLLITNYTNVSKWLAKRNRNNSRDV